MYKCNLCIEDTHFDSISGIAKHLKEDHGLMYLPAIKGRKVYSYIQMKYVCAICNIKLLNSGYSLIHLNKEHNVTTGGERLLDENDDTEVPEKFMFEESMYAEAEVDEDDNSCLCNECNDDSTNDPYDYHYNN